MIKKKKLRYLFTVIPILLGVYFYNNITTQPTIIEKIQKFGNVKIINYSNIKTGVKLFSDIKGEKTKEVACKKFSSGDVNQNVVLRQTIKYESYGYTLIIGNDSVQTNLTNTVQDLFFGYTPTYDSLGFTQIYSFEGNLSLKEIRSKLNEGEYQLQSRLIINNQRDADLRNIIKDSLALKQLKGSLDYMIENPEEISIDSNKKYLSYMIVFPELGESTPLDSVCKNCLGKTVK